MRYSDSKSDESSLVESQLRIQCHVIQLENFNLILNKNLKISYNFHATNYSSFLCATTPSVVQQEILGKVVKLPAAQRKVLSLLNVTIGYFQQRELLFKLRDSDVCF